MTFKLNYAAKWLVLLMCRYIRGEAEKTSCVTRDVGNVMVDTEITFEYGIRTKTYDQTGIVLLFIYD